MSLEPGTRFGVRAYELVLGKGRLVLSGFHLFVGAVVLIVLPQILYLLSRNITLQLSTAPYVFLRPVASGLRRQPWATRKRCL